MKRLLALLSILVVLPLMATSSVIAATPSETDLNAEADARVAQIQALYDARDRILYQETVDLIALNEIDLQLHNLGVAFLNDAEVAAKFPDAKSAIESSGGSIVQSTTGSSNIQPRVDIPTSTAVSWTTYRVSGYWYGSRQYDIQFLSAVPLTEDSVLWREEAELQHPSIRWIDGAETLFTSVASYGLEKLAPRLYTAYEILSTVASALENLSPTTPVDIADTYFTYEVRTDVTFSYVRLIGETDDKQKLSHVASSCIVDFTYTMDVNEYETLPNGEEAPVPKKVSPSIHFTDTSPYKATTARACHAYAYSSLLPVNDCISSIDITGPNGVQVYTIYPPAPNYPYQADPQ